MSAPLPPFHDYLVGTLIDDPAELREPRPPIMKRMCCGRRPDGEPCELVLGWMVCTRASVGRITWGYCGACFDQALEEVDSFTLDVGAGDEPATRAATPTPQGPAPHERAVNDNASEAPGLPDVLPSPTP